MCRDKNADSSEDDNETYDVSKITQQVLNELKQSNKLLQSIFNTSLIGISVLEAVRNKQGEIEDFRIKIVNKELERETKRTDLPGKLYLAEYPGIKKLGLFDLMLKVMETGQPAQLEYYYPYEGFNKWFSSMFVKAEDGLVATNLDITKSKLAEDEKTKSLLLLQQSEQLALIGSWEYDLATRVITWSEGMYQLFDLKKGIEVEPEIYLQYVTEKSRHTAERIVHYIRSGLAGFEATIELLTGNHYKTVKLKATVMYDENDKPEKVLGVDIDITAIKNAEEQIREDAIFIKGIADAAPDMLYVIDINKMQMVYANDKITELFQKNAEELKDLGRFLFDIIVYAPDRAKFDESIKALKKAKDGEVKMLTYRLVDAFANIHWIKARRTIYKRDSKGVPTHIIGVSQDITEQVRLEEKNAQLVKENLGIEKRRQQEIFKITLTTQEEERKRIAESLHNSLGQVLYAIKLNLEQVDLYSPDNIADNLNALRQTSMLLEEAIQESRRISHELTPTILEHFGLEAAVEDICLKLGRTNAVAINCEFDKFPCKIDKYAEIAIYRILQELILNIVKHSKATNATIKTKASTNDIIILAEDNGTGFDTSDKNLEGIGLKLLRSKAKLLNGKIYISSTDKGTLISVKIPNVICKDEG